MTGYPQQPTPTSDHDREPAEVVGTPGETDETPGDTPGRSAPDPKPALRTSETMPPAEGIHVPEDDPDLPE